MIAEYLYCIKHGKVVQTIQDERGVPAHLVQAGKLFSPKTEWCEGPYASCTPPNKSSDSYWKAVFANEELEEAQGFYTLDDPEL